MSGQYAGIIFLMVLGVAGLLFMYAIFKGHN